MNARGVLLLALAACEQHEGTKAPVVMEPVTVPADAAPPDAREAPVPIDPRKDSVEDEQDRLDRLREKQIVERKSDGTEADAISRTIKSRLVSIKECYSKELEKRPGLRTKVNMTIKITAAGDVLSASPKGDPAVGACIAGIIKGVKFPRTSSGLPATIRYPFIFSSQ